MSAHTWPCFDTPPATPCPRRSLPRHRRRRQVGWLAGLATAIWACTSAAAAAAGLTPSLAELSLEELREVVVSTVSRSEERLDGVAASVYVISADDLRRAGARTLPEALRLAPTLTVARADANQYAIAARGFNNVLANKMLVLVDGRTLYTPLFSGVFWEAQDVALDDVERIEVITGPSTAMWGSNAVTGLIHVITRNAGDTQGAAAALAAGTAERAATLRLGGAWGAAGGRERPLHYRLYVKAYDRDSTRRADGSPVQDAADGVQFGGRADWSDRRDSLTVQGDAYEGRIDPAPIERRFSGANINARWQRDAERGSQTSVQLVLEHSEREHRQSFADTLSTVDLVAQHALAPAGGHRVVLGGGLRHVRDRASQTAALAFQPEQRSLAWQRVFAQDRVQLGRALELTLAASVERNPYTGTETLPSLRLAWNGGGGVLWASLSRAVRAPSRVDRDLFLPGRAPYLVAGGPHFDSEISRVAELGWRAQAGPALSYAVTLYHARHRQLRSLAPGAAGLEWRNGIEGHSRGLEAWARWQPTARWRLDAGLALLRQALRVRAGEVDLGGLAALGNSPRHHASLRSSLELGAAWRWHAELRRVGPLPQPAVPGYTAVDTRLAWWPSPQLEFSLGVQNLLDPRHPEWGVATNRVEFERMAVLQLRVNH